MKPVIKVFLYDEKEERFFGEGPYRLLCGVEETGSLRRAAAKMDMAYTKALSMVKKAEEALGFPLTEKFTGGKGGGGSRLTVQAQEFLKKYEKFRDGCQDAGNELFIREFDQ